MSTFRFRPGTRKWVKSFSQPPFGPLTSVGLKKLFLNTTVPLALASAKRIEHLHAFSVDSDSIRFGPGDCSVTLRPRLEYVPKSLSTPFERTETVSLSALATKSSPSPDHVSGAEHGASKERSGQNIVGARSGFLSKGWSDRSVSLRFRSDTAHTTSLGHAQIHPEFTCAFNN